MKIPDCPFCKADPLGHIWTNKDIAWLEARIEKLEKIVRDMEGDGK